MYELTDADITIILQGLLELPAKQSYILINKINTQYDLNKKSLIKEVKPDLDTGNA